MPLTKTQITALLKLKRVDIDVYSTATVSRDQLLNEYLLQYSDWWMHEGDKSYQRKIESDSLNIDKITLSKPWVDVRVLGNDHVDMPLPDEPYLLLQGEYGEFAVVCEQWNFYLVAIDDDFSELMIDKMEK